MSDELPAPTKTAAPVSQQVTKTRWPHNVTTLGVDVGGSGVKASVLDAKGNMITERVRVDTPYPCTPTTLVNTISELVKPLPATQRISVGFPGLVRDGVVVQVPALSRLEYGGENDPTMAARWHGFDLADALAQAFTVPIKVVNDADMQGCAVATGDGYEFVMTLGTGVGCAQFFQGKLLPHIELSHGPFKKGMTTDYALGNVNRKAIGNKKWRKWVNEAIHWFDEMLFFDKILIGGGNAKKLRLADLPPKAQVVPNTAGIIGGVRVWDLAD
ncbi:MAG: ROK family protein [Actinomycetia bacterium]|nr:ROK family protein [Actinomycetes bacterium]